MSALALLALGLALGLVPFVLSRAQFSRRVQTLTQALEAERLRQDAAARREELLLAALDAAPSAIVLFSDVGRIALTNEAARDLFFEGRDTRGENFLSMLGRAPDALRRAISGEGDELLSIDDNNGERQTYLLSKRRFVAGGEAIVVVIAKNLSRELHRQEADAWKRMIRVFSHELNNSLAPVSSLVHSARVVVSDSPYAPKLERIFSTIAERTDHLRTFLDGYARFARLPLPHQQERAWGPFVEGLLLLFPALRVAGDLPTDPGWFDPSQLEQVLINLLKNAAEAGGPPDGITLAITSLGARGVRITVADRGPGMSPNVLETALVPFYSTKERGTGLGLPLCSEIVEAHRGSLRLENREGGGLAVHVRLPGRTATPETALGKLTLTRS